MTELRTKQDEAKQTINKIFVKYRFAYNSFAKVGLVFFSSLLILINVTVALSTLQFPWSIGVYLGVNTMIVLIAI